MAGVREAGNILVSLTVIYIYVCVCYDSDILDEILNICLASGAIVLLVVLALKFRLEATFLDFISELFHEIWPHLLNLGQTFMLQVQLGASELFGTRRHHSCHCHTIKEGSSDFMIQKLKHGVINRICDGVYQANVETIGNVTFNVEQQGDSLPRESYDLAVACSNEFVLKNICVFNPNCNQVCYVMEHYEQNFKQWLQDNSLFDQQGKNLNPEFLQILRDVLRGIGYLHHAKNICHGNLSVSNIVIVNGRAKIKGMVNDASKINLDDYLDYKDLAAIVRSYFQSKQIIQKELDLFLTYISTTKPSRLLNLENHPIFLSPSQRLSYRVIAHTFLYFGNKKKSFGLALNKELPENKWRNKVQTFRMVLNRHKTLQHLSLKQRKKSQYSQSGTSFMRFGRNVVVHLKDNNFNRDPAESKKLTAEEVEEELNGYWPEFMPILHQILVEHGHLMVVHDAVLK